VLGAPDLDAELPVGSHQSGVDGQSDLPQPAGHASLGAAQDTVGFLGCKRTLVAHIITSNPKSFSAGLLSVPSSPSLY